MEVLRKAHLCHYCMGKWKNMIPSAIWKWFQTSGICPSLCDYEDVPVCLTFHQHNSFLCMWELNCGKSNAGSLSLVHIPVCNYCCTLWRKCMDAHSPPDWSMPHVVTCSPYTRCYLSSRGHWLYLARLCPEKSQATLIQSHPPPYTHAVLPLQVTVDLHH